MLGDQLATDILAAQNAGIRGILIETGVPFATSSQFKRTMSSDHLEANLLLPNNLLLCYVLCKRSLDITCSLA